MSMQGLTSHGSGDRPSMHCPPLGTPTSGSPEWPKGGTVQKTTQTQSTDPLDQPTGHLPTLVHTGASHGQHAHPEPASVRSLNTHKHTGPPTASHTDQLRSQPPLRRHLHPSPDTPRPDTHTDPHTGTHPLTTRSSSLPSADCPCSWGHTRDRLCHLSSPWAWSPLNKQGPHRLRGHPAGSQAQRCLACPSTDAWSSQQGAPMKSRPPSTARGSG